MQFKLVEFEKRPQYRQIKQAVPVRFAFAKIINDTVQQEHYPVLCRDFLLDTLIWNDNPKLFNGSIYGYSYKGPLEPIPILTLSNVKNPAGISNLIQIEYIFNPKRGSYLFPTDKKGTYVIVGDPLWYKNTTLLSFWTFCQRYFLGTKEYQVDCNLPETIDWYQIRRNVSFVEVAECLAKLPTDVPVKTSKDNNIHGPNGFFSTICYPEYSVFGDVKCLRPLKSAM